ncbi:flagellar hook-associated protein FlgL [Shewanella algae]|uniref:flagellar hook-associated protein FlgL n=1 Tax=Shewanella algae TaxID=38313 RepID=UPI0012DF1620|nr:flagellar hook-associated protein FlgL [Shewanella algae]QGS58152.1 flagellar hook-associated protein 3 [Shewanella algae]
MRVAMFNMYSANLHSMQQTLSQLGQLDQQLSSGKALLRPSDDPIGKVKVLNCERDLAKTLQYISNIDSLSTSLGRVETYLDSLVQAQTRMREIVISANSGQLSAADQQGYADELSALMDTCVDILNARDADGNYLFSGNLSRTPALALDSSGRYQFQGDAQHRQVQIAADSWVDANVTAQEFWFGNGSQDLLNQAAEYVEVLRDPAKAPGDADFEAVAGAMMQSLDDTLSSIGAAITDIGGKQNRLSLGKSSHQEMALFTKEVIGETEALDYPAATSEFQMKLTALRVSQQSFVKISQLTLFNQL